MTDPRARVVTVEILGQRYPIKSALDAAYIAELASYVDDKMRAAADETHNGDSLKIAVLAALNIADEYFRCREAESLRDDLETVLERASTIEQLVDRALGQS